MGWFGLFNINKPPGMSSRKVVDHVQRWVRPDKAGHAGTLDPLATGVLLVCVGRATRLIETIHDSPKHYRARFRLGIRSDTHDVTGQVVAVPGACPVTASQIEDLLPEFTGRIEQRPPDYSAVHIGGERAYKLARQGQPVDVPARPVEVHRIELLDFDPREIELAVECSSGTYIRSLARDLGERLACGAVMSELVRTRIGLFGIDEAISLDDVTAESAADLMLPPEPAVSHLPRYTAELDELADIRHGRPFNCRFASTLGDQSTVAVFTPDDELACLARFQQSDGTLRPKPVFLADCN